MKLSKLIDTASITFSSPPKTLASFFYWSLKGSFPALSLAGFISVLTGVLEVSAVLLLGLLIDAALTSSLDNPLESNVGLFSVGLVFFLVLRPIVFGASSYMQAVIVSPNIFNLVLSRVHRWTLGQSVQFFDNDFAGRIAQKEMQTARAVTDVVVEILQTVLFALASVVGAALMLSSVNPFLALGLGLWLFTYFFFIRYFMPLIRQRSGDRANSRAMVTGQIVDTVTNMKTVKLFAHSDHEDKAAIKAMDVFNVKSVAYGKVAALFRFCLNGLAGILPILMVGGSLWFWNSGVVSAGDIAAAGAISLRLSQMIGWVSYTLMALYSNLGEVEDGVKTLAKNHDLNDIEDAKKLKVMGGKIQFENIHFSYDRKVGGVSGVSLVINPGEKVGVVGASGAGKSTLVSILLRLYDPENGMVKIDNQDLTKVTQESLRQQIGMVTQETALFNRPARDNILYGRADATIEEMIYAAKQAEAHEFILNLEDHNGRQGYDAFLGEQGVKLSGGQRQRIALARAILKDAPILVLDEATSALDSEVESSIQFALERVMKGKTVLAIAHRLSTLNKMDKIIVMEEGRIVESGNHLSLLDKKGLYYRYWERQSGGFIETGIAAE